MERSMSDQAQERLSGRCARLGLADPREAYRRLLVDTKARDVAAFARATSHYKERVLPALAGDADALDTWIDYGRYLGELAGEGSMQSVDATGRATAFRSPLAAGTLVLYLMDGGTRGSFVAVQPRDLSAAQQATIALLVEGRLDL
jgi:hypothetical protein